MTTPSNRIPPANLHVVLVHPEIPHNTGAIGRLCVGLDATLHLVKPIGFDLDSASIRRCGLDYWDSLKLRIHPSWENFLATVPIPRLVFFSRHAQRSLYDCRFETGQYLVFGSESTGFPESFHPLYAYRMYSIPMPGPNARSLNLANAASVAAYEAYRQISTAPQPAP